MSWLSVTISAYLILAVVILVDKYLLVGSIPNPKVYTFYVGMLGILILVLVPFVGFSLPETGVIILSLLAGALFIYAISWFYKALALFEASRVVPTIGGILPIFTFLLVYIFSGGKETLNFREFLAFIFLVLGGALIAYEKSKQISFQSFKVSTIAAFFFAVSFVLTKYVYLAQPFWSGYILIKVGGVLMAMGILFTAGVKNELFKTKINFQKKTAGIFLSNQAMGITANILQNWAIALAPLAYVAVINALQGTQYAFLLILTVFLSLKFPKILKEEISKEIIFQKIVAILLIGMGLVILTLG